MPPIEKQPEQCRLSFKCCGLTWIEGKILTVVHMGPFFELGLVLVDPCLHKKKLLLVT